jgi:hypothetical protein
VAQFLSEVGCGPQMIDELAHAGDKIEFVDKTSEYALDTI